MKNKDLIQLLLTPNVASPSKHSFREQPSIRSIYESSRTADTDNSLYIHPVLISSDGFVDDRHLLNLKQDNQNLFDFFSYLLNRTSNQTLKQTDSYREAHPGFESALVVAFFQVFIIILVFFCVVFMYNCNAIMKVCRNYTMPEAKPLEEELYNDKRTVIDYLCLPFDDCHKLKRFTRRKKRKPRGRAKR